MKREPPPRHSELAVIAVLIALGMLGMIGVSAASAHRPAPVKVAEAKR